MKKSQKEMYPFEDQEILDEFKVEELEERLEMTSIQSEVPGTIEVGVTWKF